MGKHERFLIARNRAHPVVKIFEQAIHAVDQQGGFTPTILYVWTNADRYKKASIWGPNSDDPKERCSAVYGPASSPRVQDEFTLVSRLHNLGLPVLRPITERIVTVFGEERESVMRVYEDTKGRVLSTFRSPGAVDEQALRKAGAVYASALEVLHNLDLSELLVGTTREEWLDADLSDVLFDRAEDARVRLINCGAPQHLVEAAEKLATWIDDHGEVLDDNRIVPVLWNPDGMNLYLQPDGTICITSIDQIRLGSAVENLDVLGFASFPGYFSEAAKESYANILGTGVREYLAQNGRLRRVAAALSTIEYTATRSADRIPRLSRETIAETNLAVERALEPPSL